MKDNYKKLLKVELEALLDAAKAVRFSLSSCEPLFGRVSFMLKDLEPIEALTSRFGRLGDILIQRVCRSIDEIELENEGTVLDRINRAEKRNFGSADMLVEARRLRNRIAHEYVPDAAEKFFKRTYELSGELLESVKCVEEFCKERYGISRS